MARSERLSAAFVKSIAKPGRYGDGRGGYGLMLDVRPMKNGRIGKRWYQRVRLDGKPTHLSIGPYSMVTLAEARMQAFENAKSIYKEMDPRSKKVPTFAEAVETVISIKQPTWKDGAQSARIWRSRFETYAFPIFGNKPIDKVTAGHITAAIEPIWHNKLETAKRTRRQIAIVLNWAVTQGYRNDNPAEAVISIMPTNGKTKKHFKAIPHGRVTETIEKIHLTAAWEGTKWALQFLILTAARSAEVRKAKWNEIDFDKSLWTIPAERMKTKREHIVPLSPQALDVLDDAGYSPSNDDNLIFPSPRGKVLSINTFGMLFKSAGIQRNAARDALNLPRLVRRNRTTARDCGACTSACSARTRRRISAVNPAGTPT